MRMPPTRNQVIVILFGIILCIFSCTSNPEDAIVGKWQQIDGTETVEFFKEGTITIDPDDMPSMSGNYSFIDKDRIKIELGGRVGSIVDPMVLKVQITRNELTTTFPKGKPEKYRRVD